MKNTTKKKLIKALSAGLKITVIGAAGLVFMGCPSEQEEQTPVSRSENITLAAGKSMTVHFTALPDATPSWWGKLSSKLQFFAVDFPTGNYTLTVTDGTGGFVAGAYGSKSTTVSENWLSGATDDDMNVSLSGMLGDWISMNKKKQNQNRIWYAGGMSSFELAQVKKNSDIV